MAHHLINTATGSSLVPIAASRLLRRRWQQAASPRQLAELAISDFAAVQHRRLEAAGCVGRAALRQIAKTSDLEGILGRLSPLAVSRLEGASNLITMGIAEILDSTMERLAHL
jgi:hypothetical protein